MTLNSHVPTGNKEYPVRTIAALLIACAGLCGAPPAPAADFNNDGYADAVVGQPSVDYLGDDREGAVLVMYGSSSGLTTAANYSHWIAPDDIETDSYFYWRFGSAVAVGNFDGDAYDDFAVGAPGANSSAGQVWIFYGTGTKGVWAEIEMIDQATPGSDADWEYNDHFGAALAAGDFDGDGVDDLAVAAPNDSQSGIADAGIVQVFYGTASVGIRDSGVDQKVIDQLIHQNSSIDGEGSIDDACEANDYFGYSLAAGDFDNDGAFDLAVGIPGENYTKTDEGAVSVIYGSKTKGRLTLAYDDFIRQNWFTGAAAETSDQYGWALAAGKFNSGDYWDLAIGAPYEDIESNGAENAGAVAVVFGGSGGLTSSGSEVLYQSLTNVDGVSEDYDHFGWALGAGDVNGGSAWDLVVGIPDQNVVGEDDSGAIHIFYGTANGFIDGSSVVDTEWDQDDYDGLGNMAGGCEDNDHFGSSVAVGNFNGGSWGDVLVGIPGEAASGESGYPRGYVQVIYGSGLGLTTYGNKMFSPGSDGLDGISTTNAEFGASVGSN